MSGVLGTLVGNGILKGIAVGIGLILLIIPGIFLGTIWAVTAPAIVVERVGVLDAFSRSWELVQGNFWPVLGAYVLGFLIVIGVSIVASAIGIAIGLAGLIILIIIAGIITAPVLALISAILFFDLGGGQVAAAPAAPRQPPPGRAADRLSRGLSRTVHPAGARERDPEALALEIERRFLIESTPGWLSDRPSEEIEQGYLTESADSVQVRIRHKDGESILGIKRGTGKSREETEVTLSAERAGELWG